MQPRRVTFPTCFYGPCTHFALPLYTLALIHTDLRESYGNFPKPKVMKKKNDTLNVYPSKYNFSMP